MKNRFQDAAATLRCMWRLRPHLRGGRYLMAAVAASALVAALLDGIGVSLLVPLLSLLLGGEGAKPMRPISMLQSALPGQPAAFYVLVFCGLVLAAIAGKNLLLYGSQLLGAKLKRRISTNLRLSLFTRLHHADLSLFEQRPAGELANIFLSETGRVSGLVDYLLLLGQRASIGTFYLALLLFISWQLTLLTLVLAGGIGWMIRFTYRRLAQSGRETVELYQRLAKLALESFAGIRVVRSTHSQEREIGRLSGVNDAVAAAEERSARTGQLIPAITETISVAGAMVIIGCAYSFFVRPGLMLSSHLLGFGFILLRLLPLINQLYGLQGNVVLLAQSVKTVEGWLESPQFPGRPFGTAEFTRVSQGIRFEQVSYVYPNGTRALDNLSFEIPAGKTVALVGASGSGKSTVVSLLLRFRGPSSGRILVDGRDYWDFSAESWHGAIGVVEQEAFLFHDTLAGNIGYGFPRVSPEAVQAAVRVAHLEDMVESLPAGLDTVVGERGTMLSGGQRQRLAIARAVVRDAQILILDEATSSLDTLSERQVQEAIEAAAKGRTVLVIAHRLSTVRRADWLVVLQAGQVVEQGTWDGLSAKEGVFATLLRHSMLRA